MSIECQYTACHYPECGIFDMLSVFMLKNAPSFHTEVLFDTQHYDTKQNGLNFGTWHKDTKHEHRVAVYWVSLSRKRHI